MTPVTEPPAVPATLRFAAVSPATAWLNVTVKLAVKLVLVAVAEAGWPDAG